MSPNSLDSLHRTTGATALGRLWQALLRLVRSWCLSDRVRATRSEGRILRLRPHAIIVYNKRQLEVLDRSVGRGQDGAYLSYNCQTDNGPVELRLAVVGSVAFPRIVWIENGCESLLSEVDLEIWER